jgi:hypothetical protein
MMKPTYVRAIPCFEESLCHASASKAPLWNERLSRSNNSTRERHSNGGFNSLDATAGIV